MLPYVAPGILDIQVNGYNGADYNTLPLDGPKIIESVRALQKGGVTGFLPTLITNSSESIEGLISAFNTLLEQNKTLREVFIGFHLEGPFISKEDGPRGAHASEFVIPPDIELVKTWQTVAEGRIKILTLSPEWDGSNAFIAACTDMGIRVAIGHTSASCKQIEEAALHGASLSTHLGNGCHLQMHRHTNYIWQQLAEDDLWASVIADGFHLPKQVLKTIIMVKGSKLILVSDATCFGGMEPGEYHAHIGGDVTLTPAGKLHLSGNEECLAGSAQPILGGINHLLSTGLCDLEKAWSMASQAPAAYLQLNDRGEVAAGNRADLVFFSLQENRVVIERVLLRGLETIYSP